METFVDAQRGLRVSDSLLFVCDPGVSDDNRDALTLTTWAAEMSADQMRLDIRDAPAGWLNACQRTMTKLGWVTVEREFETLRGNDSDTLENAARQILTAKLGNSKLTQRLLSHVDSLDDWPSRPRWVGTGRQDGDSALSVSTVLVSVVPRPGEILTEEAEAGQRDTFRVEIWRGTLNATIFGFVRPRLLKRLRDTPGSRTKLRQGLSEDRRRQREFVQNLALAAPTHVHAGRRFRTACGEVRGSHASSDNAGGTPSVYVAKAELVSFVADIDVQAQRDVLNALLFAQLGADRKFDRDNDFDAWHRFYLVAIVNIGWTVQALAHNVQLPDQFTIAQLSVSLLEPRVGSQELAAAKRGLSAAEANVPGVFDEASHTLDAGSFQVTTCALRRRQIQTSVIAYYFRTNERVERVMAHTFDRHGTTMVAHVYRCRLDLDSYSAIARGIEKSLADNVRLFVRALET